MKPNLAPPAQAIWVDEWDNIGAAVRAFDGPEWIIKHAIDRGQRSDIVVSVIGLQYADGHALREIIIDCPDTPIITPGEARKVGKALIAAADSAEGDVGADALLDARREVTGATGAATRKRHRTGASPRAIPTSRG